MRIHRGLKIPELGRPVPFSIEPATHRGTLVCYVSGGSHQLLIAGWLSAFVAVIVLMISVLTLINQGLFAWVPYRHTQVPVALVLVFACGVCGMSYWMLRNATQRSQIVIDPGTGKAQVQYCSGTDGAIDSAKIVVQDTQLMRCSVMSTKGVFARKGAKTRIVSIVVVDVGFDCMVLGAFKKSEHAEEFAKEVQRVTKLPIDPTPLAKLKVMAAELSYGLGSSDTKALHKPFRGRAMVPIGFIDPKEGVRRGWVQSLFFQIMSSGR